MSQDSAPYGGRHRSLRSAAMRVNSTLRHGDWLRPALVWILIIPFLMLPCADAAETGTDRQVSPREADGLRVEAIRFVYPGEQALSNRDLRSAMRIQEGGRFRHGFFRGDLATLVALYQSRGYREAQITRRQLIVDENDRLRITIELDSGPRWRVRQVSVVGTETFSVPELLAQVPVATGDDLNYGRVLEGERNLQIYLNRRGHARATISNEWIDYPESHIADVIYHVNAGPRMYIGEITIQDEDDLQTRSSLVWNALTFKEGDLYDPGELSRSRQALTETELFRSVFFSTPERAIEDSLQPVHIRLQERKFIVLDANAYVNYVPGDINPRVAGSIQHINWLGRGMKLGLDASWGEPLQGGTVFMMERDLLRSGADLVLSVGVTDRWGGTQVFADPDEERQFDLLTTNDSVLEGLLLFGGEDVARQYIQTVVYDYTAITRRKEISGTLSRRWFESFNTQARVDYTRARSAPDPTRNIRYTPSDIHTGPTDPGDDDPWDDDPWDDPWDDDPWNDDPWNDDPWGNGDNGNAANGTAPGYLDYSDGHIPIDGTWKSILTDRSRSINLSTEIVRDTRDSQIAPSRGSFVRLSGLYAIQLDARTTDVVDGTAEVRQYQRLSRRFTLAMAGQYTRTAAVDKDRALPQVYWKRFGGDGSVRGVERDGIVAIGGGRTGVNLRAELRYQSGAFGMVGFLDRGNVWRRSSDYEWHDLIRPSGMVDGYGIGLRYVVGFPFRLDIAFSDGFNTEDRFRIYFSIGQAF